MRSRSNSPGRVLTGWLIAALLLAQQGALWHVFEHFGADRNARGLAVSPNESDQSAPVIGCAKCLAFAALEHATPASAEPPAVKRCAAAPAQSVAPASATCPAPAACSRDPPAFALS
ncbi:MAG: hypothetical protein WCF44_01470 [Candidatus Methylophosphatis roskildensis]